MTGTFFDILILIVVVGGAAWGFYRGFFRQAIGTLAIYVSTVVSTVGYRGLSNLISGANQPSTPATDTLAFIIMMAVTNFLLALIGNDLVKDIDIRRMGIWVQIGGMAFGFINTAIWGAVLLIILRSATSGEPWIAYQNIQTFFLDQTQNSWMAYVFRPFMRFIVAIVRPWLFGRSLPPLFMSAM
jgi:uncharacterized membrane protein required for colicin V production